MSAELLRRAAAGRTCDWCGLPAPEGDALLSIWWADYECCSMECVMLAEDEANVVARAYLGETP